MKTPAFVALTLPAFLALTLACGRTGVTPEGPCDHTLCPGGYVCDVADGTCKTPDLVVGADGGGGVPDGGPLLDAGFNPDGGGVDAGVDAGVSCPGGCNAPQFCDPAANNGAGACVTCNSSAGCTSPAAVCDVTVPGGVCVTCTSDIHCQSPTPACHMTSQTCVECTDSAQCSPGAPICDPLKNKCVKCTSNLNCAFPTPVCDQQSQTCRGCVQNADCTNPSPICQPMTQQCVPCTNSSQCAAGNVCSGGSCIPQPDTCATAQAITFPMGSTTTTFQADTTGATDNDVGTCNSIGGRELVYTLTLTGTTDLVVSATRPGNSNANPAVYVRSMTCAGSQIACSNMSNTSETVALKAVPAGIYFIFIESTGMSAGVLNVQVTALPAVPPPSNDDCATAQVLSFMNGTASVTGTTVSANNSNGPNTQTPTCTTSARQNGGDVVYEFTLTQARDVALTVTPTGVAPTFSPALYVRGPSTMNGCASDTERACVSAGGGQAAQSVLLPNLAAGTYYVWIDSVVGTSGPFQLDVSLTTPTNNNTCSTPRTLLFTNGVANDSGNTTFATNSNNTNDTSPTCSTSAKQNGQDVVFLYNLTTAQDVNITVTPTGAMPSFQPVVYVRAAQCGVTTAAVERACVTNFSPTPQTISLFNQAPGIYFVWVDGAQGTSGAFDISVALSPPTAPPFNDTCAMPIVLSVGSPVLGDTTTAVDTYSRTSVPAYGGPCINNNPLPWTGKDVVYQFTATATQHTVTLTPSTNFDGALMILQPVCGAAACSTFEDNSGFGAVESITLNTVVGNTYFLVVEGFNAQQFGTFVIGVN